MNQQSPVRSPILTRRLLVATGTVAVAGTAFAMLVMPNLIVGTDFNSANNPFVQPQDSALSGGGRDQTLQFGDVLRGDASGVAEDDVLIGRLGTDILFGEDGEDILIGGTEHFNPSNRDRAFGGPDKDVFLWSPGDGSDFFDGGDGIDAVVFGLMGELENGQLVFRVANDQLPGEVFIDPATGLPRMDVTSSPGFCEVLDESTSAGAANELALLEIDHLVRFFIRSINQDFVNGVQTTDNGLRVTLHLKDVEVLVCASQAGGVIEAFNLTTSPPTPLPLTWVTTRIPKLADILQ